MSRAGVKQSSVVVVSHACVVDVNQEPFRALAGRGVRVHVIAPKALRTDIRGTIPFRALDGVDATALPVRIGGFRRGVRQAGVHMILYAGLREAIRGQEPTLIYVEEEPWSFTAMQVDRIARELGVPFAFHQSQNVAKRLPPPFESIRRRVLREAAGATVRLEGAARVLRASGFTGPMLSIPNVIDPSRFDAASPMLPGLPRPVAGFVGRLVEEKGVMVFLRAAAAAKAGCVVVAGDGPLRARAEAEATRLGLDARFLGSVAHDAVAQVFAAVDVLVIPSRTTRGWKEQFGRVVIEANAAGVPVVATECGALGDTVRATGGGIVLAGGDPQGLAAAVAALAHDDQRRRRLGDAGRAAVRARFTPEAVAKDLHEFFARLEDR
ncbi:MAG TPA: glycosyltransferase family 4 protein [Actinomycetota bacterium]|nr:glycosyltransferase family 4 protein [Actinomycetota bacterium]